MTAKEELRDTINGLTEEDASAWLRRMRDEDPATGRRIGSIYKLPPGQRAAALKEFFESWRDKDAYLSDEQWEEFARDFDAQRPNRPLFT